MIVIVALSFSFCKKNTKIELLGLRENLNNPDYKLTEFEGFKNEASANAFTMSPKKRIEGVNAVGIVSKFGRYGGIFTNSDNFHYYINFFIYKLFPPLKWREIFLSVFTLFPVQDC